MEPEKKIVLMSIKPPFAERIRRGEKTIELRTRPPAVSPGDVIVFYESSPVKRITLLCTVVSLLSLPPEELWETYHAGFGIGEEEYRRYFSASRLAHGILLCSPVPVPPLPLDRFSGKIKAPQNYRYLPKEIFEQICESAHIS